MMLMETTSQNSAFRHVLGGLMVIGSLALTADVSGQNLPEPPLPIQASREASAAVQSPTNVRPPPPVPSPIPNAGAAGKRTPSAGGSPIPPQAPDAMVPPPRNAGGPPAPPLPTGFTSKITLSTSGSGQFKVYGKDLQTRSPFSTRCDEIADRLRRLLHDDEPWVLPVVLAIKTAPDIKLGGPAVSTSISQITNGGFHLQVTVQVRPDLRPADVDAELTRILIAERILRNQKEISTKRSMVLPEWLLTGITQAMSFRDRSRPSAVFAAIFRSGKIYGIEEILDTAPGQLDALSRTIYETSCCALVLALLDQPEGPASLRKFLSLLAVDSRDDRALLNYCFPTLALSASSLNKWWSLQMASLATPSVFETLGPSQTRKALTEALTIRYETTSDAAPKKTTVLADADEPPAETPVEEKKSGLFGNLFGGASPADAGKKPAEDRTKTDKPKPAEVAKTKPAPPAKPAAEAAPEEKKRGILGRMFGASTTPAEEPPAEPKAETAAKTEPAVKPEPKKIEEPKPAVKSVAEAPAAEEKKPGLFGRMFGGGARATEEPAKDSKETKAPEKTPEPAAKTEPEKVQKPKPEPKVEEKKTEPPAKKAETPKATAPKTETPKPAVDETTTAPKKRGFFGRIFGGGAEPPPEEQPAKQKDTKAGSNPPEEKLKSDEKKKSAALDMPADAARELREQWIATGDAWIAAASALWADFTSAGGHEVKLRLGFGKKKTDEPEQPTESEKPKAEKPKTEKPKAEKPKEDKPAEPAKKKPVAPEPEKKSEPQTKTKTKSKPEPSRQKTIAVSIPLEDYANIMKRKDRASILEATSRALSALVTRSNVLFRPIINDYIAVVTDLQNGKTKDVDQRLKTLRSRTAKAYDQAKAVEDHLDWFEASETKNYSGAFEDYLKLPAQIEKELPVRDDPLSKYLDALDAEFGR